jgi:formate/nitrite transporter FocA (FNT family)
LIPTLIGNLIGGVALVAVGAHAEFIEVDRMLK